jgi:hypothetical protein
MLLSSLIDVPSGDLFRAAADDATQGCLHEWLSRVPDPPGRQPGPPAVGHGYGHRGWSGLSGR